MRILDHESWAWLMTHPVYVRKEKHRGRPDGRPVSFGYHYSGSVGITDALDL